MCHIIAMQWSLQQRDISSEYNTNLAVSWNISWNVFYTCIGQLWQMLLLYCLPTFQSSVYVCLCVCLYVSVCLSVCLSVYMSPSVRLCVCLYVSVCLSVCLSICLRLSVCLSGCVSVSMSVYRVDELYAFFIQWSPNVEADDEGFVVVSENISAQMSEPSPSEPRLLRSASINKDWEVRGDMIPSLIYVETWSHLRYNVKFLQPFPRHKLTL